ncbi:MAG: YihY/virulence factor BrkB family protein [Actinomycetota bacterium]|nr:YihY/virulence factor BrkB family protein [Actinomycetota bacterium]
MDRLKRLLASVDRWQRGHKVPGAAWAVQKKVGEDNANLWVVALSWYGFTAIFPLLLVVVTVFGFVGAASLGSGLLATLRHFPIIGSDLHVGAGPSSLHGSVLGLAVGVVGMFYGAQGVTQTAEQTMSTVWNIPQVERPGFLPRLGRSVSGLLVIAATFLLNAFVTGYATGSGRSWALRVPIIAVLLALNVLAYLLAFRVLTPKQVRTRALRPGAVVGGVAFTALITLGTGLVEHTLSNKSNTYGAFGSVIGIVAFLGLLAKLSVYAAELNPVLDRRLYPRQFLVGEPTEADEQVWHDIVHQERRRGDQRIGVGFGEAAPAEVSADARQPGDDDPQPRLDTSGRHSAR